MMNVNSISFGRDTSFDSIKYVLMAFVVLGHTIGPIDNFGFNARVFTWINSFHMAAFVLISGYFYYDTNEKKFWKGIAELLIIILLFSVLYSGGGWTSVPDFTLDKVIYSITHFYAPQRALWYILCLCIWRIIMRYYPKKIRDDFKKSIPLSILISVLVGFIPISAGPAAQRTFTFFPYFMIGYMIHQKGLWGGVIRRFKHWKCFLWLILSFIIIMIVPNFPNVVGVVANPYISSTNSALCSAGLRFLSYLWMLPMTICILNVIPDINFFSSKGKDTLFYLLFHPLGITILGIIIHKYDIMISFPLLFVCSALNMFMMYWLNKIPALNYLTKPLFFIKVK